MMKHIVFLFAIFCLAQSQRPMYAGSGNRRYPPVHPQYLENQTASTSDAVGLGSRIDGVGIPGSVPVTTSTIPPDLPVDALGDIELVNRIKTWPREKQPFWFINWQQIQENRGDTRHKNKPVDPMAL
ncbi:uncharacterized protein LOC143180992 [Calliopsis andreniformis]|uniref:uncharacterized protein LOC143180992 n=1 Tax=Calliopsis andreniformis TaxID=337506 RepID=UPI003FCDBA91